MEVKISACDRTSVGIIAKDTFGRILMIKRKRYPYGYAPPAGHCDGHSYPDACFKEFKEETNLDIVGAPKPLILVKNGRTENKCRRGGEYHFWQVFEVDWSGTILKNEEETESVGWLDQEALKKLADRTRKYIERLRLAERAEDITLTDAIKNYIEKEWQASPGLETVWLDIFLELKII